MPIAIILVGAVLAALIGYKLWEWSKTRPATATATPTKKWAKSVELEIEESIQEVEGDWPYVRTMPLFYVAILASICMIYLDYKAAATVGPIMGFMFIVCDLALPYFAMTGTNSTGNWNGFVNNKGDSRIRMPMIIGATVMSLIVVIITTSEQATQVNAKNDITIGSIETTKANITAWKQQRDSIPVDRGYDALSALADTEEELAKREAGRTRCGPKCDAHTKAAADYRARAEQAKLKDELTGKIEAATKKLTSMDTPRNDGNMLAEFGSDFVGLPKDHVAKWSNMVLGLIFVILTTMMWLFVDFSANRAKQRKLQQALEEADRQREAAGLPKKYTVSDVPQIEDQRAGTAGDTIIVNAEAIRINFANDPDLLKVNDLFGSVVQPLQDAETTIPDLYREFRLGELRKSATAQYMTETTMRQKLSIIAQNREDVALSADGRVLGWVLAAAVAKAEAAE